MRAEPFTRRKAVSDADAGRERARQGATHPAPIFAGTAPSAPSARLALSAPPAPWEAAGAERLVIIRVASENGAEGPRKASGVDLTISRKDRLLTPLSSAGSPVTARSGCPARRRGSRPGGWPAPRHYLGPAPGSCGSGAGNAPCRARPP